MTRQERFVLGGILAVAALLRVAWCLYAARLPSGGLHDPNFYLLYGQQLANGNGYRLLDGAPTAYYPPGYPFALAPFMWLGYRWPLDRFTNPEVGIVATLNIAWQLGTMVLTFLVARRLTGRAVAGYVAAGVLALWPNLVFHTAAALTESLFLCLLLGSVWLVISAPAGLGGPWSPTRLAGVGVLLGAATLVRPVSVPVFGAVLVGVLVAGAGWRVAVARTAAITVVAVAVVVPWLVRNAIVMEQVTLSTNTGDNLCMSRHVGASGGFELPNDRCFVGEFDRLQRPEFELARDAHGREVAIEFVREHPGEELRLVFRRVGAMFTDDADGLAAVESYGDDRWMDAGTRERLRTLATGFGAAAGAAGLVGIAALLVRRRSAEAVVVALAGLGTLLPPLVFFGDPRFHVPAVPVAAVGAGALAAYRAYRSTS